MTSVSNPPAEETDERLTSIAPEMGAEVAPPVKPKKKKLTKAEKKELKRLREIEWKKMEIQAHFKRELELSRKTAKKLDHDWEDTLKEMKLIELKKELVVWKQKASRTFQEKDEKLESMMTCIGDLEEMNQLVAGKLKNLLNHITNVYKALVDSSRALYDNEAHHLIVDFQEGLNEKKSYADARRLHCENIMHTTNLIYEQELLDDYNIFVERRNENVNIAIERRYKIRDAIVKKMKESRQQLLNFVQQLMTASLDPHKYERIHYLMGRQRAFYVESQRLNELESKQQRLCGDLQKELLQTEMRFQRKLNDLRLEQSYFMEIRKSIEKSIRMDRVFTFDKLKVISSESYVVLKEFEKLRDFGELLLSISSNVRKLQTEAEKVVIWGDFLPSEYSKAEMDDLRRFAITTVDPGTHIDLNTEELYQEMNLMRIFWRRMAIVKTQNAMLEKQKEELLAENKKYTDFIKSFSNVTEPEKLIHAVHIECIIPTIRQCPDTSKS